MNNSLRRWYREQLFFATPRHGEAIARTLAEFQSEYEQDTERACRGFRRRTSISRCSHPLCPACWHNRNAYIYESLPEFKRWPYIYLRRTWPIHWRAGPHPLLLKRFKIRNPSVKMLVYGMTFDASGISEIDEATVRGDPFHGEMAYQLIGLFASERPFSEYNTDHAGQVYVTDKTGDVVGLIDSQRVYGPELQRMWLENLTHPWRFRRHQLFSDYLRHFDQTKLGRTWSRVNKIYS